MTKSSKNFDLVQFSLPGFLPLLEPAAVLPVVDLRAAALRRHHPRRVRAPRRLQVEPERAGRRPGRTRKRLQGLDCSRKNRAMSKKRLPKIGLVRREKSLQAYMHGRSQKRLPKYIFFSGEKNPCSFLERKPLRSRKEQ